MFTAMMQSCEGIYLVCGKGQAVKKYENLEEAHETLRKGIDVLYEWIGMTEKTYFTLGDMQV